MITKNLYKYACENFDTHIRSITELSKSDDGKSLVESEKELYSFDAISQKCYLSNKYPSSADGLYVDKKTIQLIEFKSGFKKKIAKENLDKETATCPYSKNICKDYWGIFFKNQKKETKGLIDSIRFKAIESYFTIEKKILPLCEKLDPKKMQIKLMIVIDEDGIDSMEDILDELSDGTTKTDNCFDQIKKSLKSLNKQKDAHGNDYFYDHIEVRSVPYFHNYIKNYL